MKHDKKRISKIVDELVTYFFSMGAKDININLKDEEKCYKIYIKCDYSCSNKEKIDKLIKHLKCEKQEEMEEYFWELAGDSDVDTELTLVGMMTDEAYVNCSDNIIEVNLVRYKN